jgi:ribose transport system ATP-binding protein
VSKAYAALVLQAIDLDLHAGEVHALVGANGAGKSTLARIVCGLTRPDAGHMTMEGATYLPESKSVAEAAGVQVVQQELNVLPTLTVGENLLFGRWPARGGWIRRGELRDRTSRILAEFGLGGFDPDMPAASLGVGEQQLLEIAGTLESPCRVLILDEPTAALTDPQIDLLFGHVERLKRQGAAIVYISHRMEELRRIADRVSVLRDGRLVTTRPMADVTTDTLLALMAGDRAGSTRETVDRERKHTFGPVALRVQDLSRGRRVRGVSFEVRRGEVLGLAGLIGAGRTELLRAIYGADRAESGAVFVGGDPHPRRFGHPRQGVRAGLGLIPEDRKTEGLLLSQPIRVNATLARVWSYARTGGWMDRGREAAESGQVGRSLALKADSVEQPVGQLSGGNQQKVVLGRWLLRDPDVWLLDEPTRGIDMAARAVIYGRIRELAARGKAIVVVSSDLEELMELSDRIAAISDGRLVATFERGHWSHEAILEAAFREHLRAGEGAR